MKVKRKDTSKQKNSGKKMLIIPAKRGKYIDPEKFAKEFYKNNQDLMSKLAKED